MLIFKTSSLDSSKILFAVLCISLLIQLCIEMSLFILLLSCSILIFIRKYKIGSAVLIVIVYQILVIRMFSSSEDVSKEKKVMEREVEREVEKEAKKEAKKEVEKEVEKEAEKEAENDKDNIEKDNLEKDDIEKGNDLIKVEDPSIVVEDFHPTKTYQIVLNVEAENIHSVRDEMNQELSFKTSTTVFN